MKVIVLSLLVILSCSAYGADKYLKKSVYEETDCTGAAVWTIITLNICAPPPPASGATHNYEISNCTEDGVSTLYCEDSNCTNCRSSPLNDCYAQTGGGSSNYECVDTIPEPPQGSFVQERFEGSNCTGRSVSFQSYAKDYCVAGEITSKVFVCSDEGVLTVKTCRDSGLCTTDCNSGAQTTGCTDVNEPTVAGISLRISCTSGDAIKTTGSSTSTSSGIPSTSSDSTTTTTDGSTAVAVTTTGGVDSTSQTTTQTASSTTQITANTTQTSSAAQTTGTVTSSQSSTNGVSSSTSEASTTANEATTASGVISTTGTTGRTIVVTVQEVSSSSVLLSWELGTVRRREEYYFIVEVAEQAKLSQVVYNGTGTSFRITSLKSGTDYDVYVSYYTSGGRQAFVSRNFSTVATTAAPITPNNTTPSDDTGTIVGVVVGVILLLIIVILVVFFILRRRKKMAKSPTIEFDYGAPTASKRRPTYGLSRIGSGITLRDPSRNSTNPTYSEVSETSSGSPSLSATQEITPPSTEHSSM